MRTLAVLAVALLVTGSLVVPAKRVEAKGPVGIVIGGGDLGPYYYAIPEVSAIQGWVGLLPGDASGQPSGRIADPPDAAALLEHAYDLYFDDMADYQPGVPHASYVPASATHPAYLYWRTPSGGMQYVAWFELGEPAHRYLDDALRTAASLKATGGIGLETDWIAAFIKHGRYYTGQEGPPSVTSDVYVVTRDGVEFHEGDQPLARIEGADAKHLLDAYIATLHHWHETSYRPYQYDVYVPDGRFVFAYEPALAGAPGRVGPAEGSGDYDADPALDALMRRALGLQATASHPAVALPSRSSAMVAAVVAGALFVATIAGLGLWVHRRQSVVGVGQ